MRVIAFALVFSLAGCVSTGRGYECELRHIRSKVSGNIPFSWDTGACPVGV